MLATGTEIGGYRIEKVLGRGGMGVVYEATQLSLGRTIALKLLAGELGEDPAFRERFRREARLQAGIDHAHIVSVYEAGEVDGGMFIAMRLVRGTDLKRLIRSGELTPQRTVTILLAVADALDTAHESGLTHRDIKPQNILVGRRDHAYLADFGLTKGAADTGYTRTGQLMGTLDYVSPEQIGGAPATAASDLYALAAVAFECLTGRPPFARPTEAAVLYAHMAEPPPAATAERPELPAAVDGVLAQGLAKAPSQRPATALDLVTSLREALEGGPALPPPPEAPALPPPPDAEDTAVREAPGSPTLADRRRPVAEPEPPAPRRRLRGRREPPPAPPVEAPRDEEAGDATERLARPPAAARKRAAAERADAERAAAERAGERAGAERAEADRVAGERVGAERAPAERAAGERVGVDRAAAERAEAERVAAAGRTGEKRRTATTRATHRSTTARRRRVAVASMVAGALALGAGYLAGEGTQANPAPRATPPTARAVAAPDLAVRVPARWRALDEAPAVPGVSLVRAAGAAPPGGDGAVAFGVMDGAGRTLLPAGLLDALGEAPEPAATVRLGRLEAYRYDDLRPDGAGDSFVLYAAPTRSGVAALACVKGLPRGTCDGIAATLRPGDTLRPLPIGPRRAYAEPLRAALRALRRRQGDARRTLARADTRRAQAAAVARIGAAYGRAAAALRRIASGPLERDAHATIVRATRDAQAAYRRTAAAARAGRSRRYDQGRRTARAADARVRRAVAALAGLGYRLT